MVDKLSDSVVIVTLTYYDLGKESDRCRAELAKGMINDAIKFGYTIVVVDGGSSEEFLDEIKGYGANVFVEEEKGMGNARRQGFREAFNCLFDFVIIRIF